MAPTVEKGIYRHYKGEFYEVLGTACLSSGECFVVCKKDTGEMDIYPCDMFFDFVIHDNAQVPRFTLISKEAIVTSQTTRGIA